MEGGSRKWSISPYGSSVRGTWRRTRRLWERAPFSKRASLGKLEEGPYTGGLGVEEESGTGVSPYRNPVGETGEGVPSTGNFEN